MFALADDDGFVPIDPVELDVDPPCAAQSDHIDDASLDNLPPTFGAPLAAMVPLPVAAPPAAPPAALCAPVTTAPPSVSAARAAAARDARARRKQKISAKKAKKARPSKTGAKGHYPERAMRAKHSQRVGGRFAKPTAGFISVTEFQ